MTIADTKAVKTEKGVVGQEAQLETRITIAAKRLMGVGDQKGFDRVMSEVFDSLSGWKNNEREIKDRIFAKMRTL